MSMQTIQRTAVRTLLSAVRLPLSAAEVVAGKQGAQWPPALAFSGFEAGVKRGLGALLGDPQLIEEGLLERGKVDQLARAAELEEAAARRRAEGEARYEERSEAVEEASQQALEQQRSREAKLAQDQARREEAAEAKARKKQEAAQAAEEARQKVVAAQERQARTIRLQEESQALAQERDAVEAKQEVVEVDRALEATRAVRKQKG